MMYVRKKAIGDNIEEEETLFPLYYRER